MTSRSTDNSIDTKTFLLQQDQKALFRQGPLVTKIAVDGMIVELSFWYSSAWLYSTLEYRKPVEFEQLVSDEITGALPDTGAGKSEA